MPDEWWSWADSWLALVPMPLEVAWEAPLAPPVEEDERPGDWRPCESPSRDDDWLALPPTLDWDEGRASQVNGII